MDQALLLSSVDAVISRIEVRHENPCEAAENVLKCASVARIAKNVGHTLKVRKYPHVAELLINCDFRLVSMHNGSRNNVAQNLSVKLTIFSSSVDYDAKRNGLSKADLPIFSKLFDDGLERGQEAEAFSWRQIGGHDDVLEFLVGHLINVEMTRQPAP